MIYTAVLQTVVEQTLNMGIKYSKLGGRSDTILFSARPKQTTERAL